MERTGQCQPYVSQRGHEYTLELWNGIPRDGRPTQFWSYSRNGYGPSVGYHVNPHLTPDAVIARIEAEETVEAVLATIPNRLTRAEYEALAAQYGFEPVANDRELSYVANWGEFHLPEYTEQQIIVAMIHRRRGLAYLTEQESRPAAPIETRACNKCGVETPVPQLMNASLMNGVCPDCYDSMSD